ncbi:MAG: hypothetical protein GX075_08915 [Firmicutes bacterium]|nr:hypothetical protein [Bacillota bacterium]
MCLLRFLAFLYSSVSAFYGVWFILLLIEKLVRQKSPNQLGDFCLGTAKYAKEFYNKCQIKKLIKANLLKTRNLKDFSDNGCRKLLSSLYFESFGIKAKGGAIYRAIF